MSRLNDRIGQFGYPAAILLGSLVLGGCDSASTSRRNSAPVPQPNTVLAETPQEDPLLAIPTLDMLNLVDGNNEFAFDLYKKLAEKDRGNIIVSPLGISTALAMTFAGAKGKTQEEMAKVLHFNLPPERLHKTIKALTASLQLEYPERYCDIHIANSLWTNPDLSFTPGFLALTHSNYGAGLRTVDFGQPEAARTAINRWFEEQTKGSIKEIVGQDDLPADTLVALTNAIHFHGSWHRPFSGVDTRNEVFEETPDKKYVVPMMHHNSEPFKYGESGGFQWLELPYAGNRFVITLLLPKSKGDLFALEETLTASSFQKHVVRLGDKMGDTALPRFRVTVGNRLKEHLRALGMKTAFSATADFLDMANVPGLRISTILHKGFIECDEVGTIASDGTFAAGSGSGTRFSFRADHPFLFFIRDITSGAILFQGRVTDPRVN